MEPLDQQFTDFYRVIGKSYNLDDLTSMIYARLFIDPDEVAMEDLAKETGYSLASISNKLKILETCGVVVRRTRPGTRKVYVYAQKDMMKIVLSSFVLYQQGEVVMVKTEIPRLLEGLKGKKLGKREKAQKEILEKYYEDTLMFDEMITRFLAQLTQEQQK
jgi:DNA-binding transcriptional regulator GbsR (MarR family)